MGKYRRIKIEDIKDGLLKMILFTNLDDVKIDGKQYTTIPVLKLTIEKGFKMENLNKSQREILDLLQKEAEIKNFQIKIS